MKTYRYYLPFLTLLFALLFSLNSCAQGKTSHQQKMNLNAFLLKHDYVRIPLNKVATGHLHLSGTLNGIEGSFILDTGASGSIIEIKNKEKFKMTTEASERQAAGAGGSSIKMEASPKNQLKLGELMFIDKELMMMNLDHVNGALERFKIKSVDGIIGADILTEHEAIIDYINLALYLKK